MRWEAAAQTPHLPTQRIFPPRQEAWKKTLIRSGSGVDTQYQPRSNVGGTRLYPCIHADPLPSPRKQEPSSEGK
jgi:hypothetical protein